MDYKRCAKQMLRGRWSELRRGSGRPTPDPRAVEVEFDRRVRGVAGLQLHDRLHVRPLGRPRDLLSRLRPPRQADRTFGLWVDRAVCYSRRTVTADPRPAPVYRRAGDYATRTLSGETVVVPIRARAAELDSVYTLNPVGAAIWAELEEPRTAEALAGRVAFDFEVALDVARADVSRFLETLLEEGMIEAVS